MPRSALVLHGPDDDLERARRRLQAEGFTAIASSRRACVRIDEGWLDPARSSLTFDHEVHRAEDAGEPFDVLVDARGAGLETIALQVATRYQRLWPRLNEALQGELAAELLGLHSRLHDRSLPLVRADYEHALDVWQWTLRLAPDAGLALQLAALFHDIERLESEALQRIEQNSADYLGFKLAHASRGAQIVEQLLRERLPEPVVTEVQRLVARHEQPGDDAALGLLNEADALSFFALNSAGYLSYYGLEQTRKKVDYTLARMRSARAREELSRLRLPPLVAEQVAHA